MTTSRSLHIYFLRKVLWHFLFDDIKAFFVFKLRGLFCSKWVSSTIKTVATEHTQVMNLESLNVSHSNVSSLF